MVRIEENFLIDFINFRSALHRAAHLQFRPKEVNNKVNIVVSGSGEAISALHLEVRRAFPLNYLFRLSFFDPQA